MTLTQLQEDLVARLVNAAELAEIADGLPDLQWVVPGVIPEGLGLIVGAPKVGKSWITLDIAIAVAAGGKAFGVIETGQPRRVLLCALEDGARRLTGRLRKLLHGADLPANLRIARIGAGVAGEYQPDEIPQLVAGFLAQDFDAPPVVIIDTLGKLGMPARKGESAYERDYRVGSTLKALADSHPGATIIIVHHTRKAASLDWMDQTSGTNGLNGAADWTANVSRGRGDDDGLLRVTGRDVREGEYAMVGLPTVWRLAGGSLEEAARRARDTEAAQGLGDRSAEIVRIVGEHPDGVGPTEVARILDIEPKDAAQYLSRAFKAGRIAKPTRGIYTPVVSVVSVVTDEVDDQLVYDTR